MRQQHSATQRHAIALAALLLLWVCSRVLLPPSNQTASKFDARSSFEIDLTSEIQSKPDARPAIASRKTMVATNQQAGKSAHPTDQYGPDFIPSAASKAHASKAMVNQLPQTRQDPIRNRLAQARQEPHPSESVRSIPSVDTIKSDRRNPQFSDRKLPKSLQAAANQAQHEIHNQPAPIRSFEATPQLTSTESAQPPQRSATQSASAIDNDFVVRNNKRPRIQIELPESRFEIELHAQASNSQTEQQSQQRRLAPDQTPNPATFMNPASRLPEVDRVVNSAWDQPPANPPSSVDTIAADVAKSADNTVQQTALTTALATPTAAPLFTQGPAASTQGTTKYRLASGPKIGDRWKSETPLFDRGVVQTETFLDDFSPDPIDPNLPYDPFPNQQVYQGKQLNANQRPLLELGQPWYQLGQLAPGSTIFGKHNSVNPQFLVFGDYRQTLASNTVDGDNVSQIGWELNTFWSLFLTGTERLVTGVSPLDNGVQNTRRLLDDDRFEFEGDFDFDFGFLEGDLGAIAGGLIGETLPFDLPFAAGLTPIFIQNGIWINDALEGLFVTVPARNSPKLNISNFDITFAYVYDQINSDAFEGDNSAAKAYACFLFIEALNGYFEIDYAFLEDRDARDRSYHNIAVAYTRRFGRFISHSTRVIANAGQNVEFGDQTADGVLLLSENSLITRHPYTVIPYFNFFAGFDTPQSFAGDQELVNTGILFESDGITGFPTLDTRARDTFGYAAGINLLAQDFSQQLILETAAVFRNDDSDLAGDQYGIGLRYQLPLSNSWIFRTDAMYGFFRSDEDDAGLRFEIRKKF